MYATSQFIPFDPFLSGGIYCSAPHPAERRSPCSWTSQDCALRCVSGLPGTAIAGAPERRTGLLPGRSQEPPRHTSARGASMTPSPAFPWCHKHVLLLSRLPFGSCRSALTAHMFMPRSSWLETASRAGPAGKEVRDDGRLYHYPCLRGAR
jgi:hypothetical protein